MEEKISGIPVTSLNNWSQSRLLMWANLTLKLGPHDAWFVFMMRHVSWFAHRVYEKMCIIWVDVSFVHSSHLVRQLGGKLTHQRSFWQFTHDAPRIRTTHRVDPALVSAESQCTEEYMRFLGVLIDGVTNPFG